MCSFWSRVIAPTRASARFDGDALLSIQAAQGPASAVAAGADGTTVASTAASRTARAPAVRRMTSPTCWARARLRPCDASVLAEADRLPRPARGECAVDIVGSPVAAEV